MHVTPWPTRAAFALIGLAAGSLAATGVLVLVMSLAGGGVSFGTPADSDPSPVFGLAFALGLLVAAGGLAYLAIGVHRGRLVASLIAVCLGTIMAAGGIHDASFAPTTHVAAAATALVLPTALVVSLLTPGHRRYVAARRSAPTASP